MRNAIDMAREAGNGELFDAMQVAFLERFADLVRADERAAPVQEPVASAAYDMVDRFLRNNLSSDDDYAEYSDALDAIYTAAAAQRTWVGLTEQEAAECWSTSTVRTWQAIEAKLREKNNGGHQLRESP
jgi:hypothetical protein